MFGGIIGLIIFTGMKKIYLKEKSKDGRLV
jgi:hypothetical protein